MKKYLLIAACLLTVGASKAFAFDADRSSLIGGSDADNYTYVSVSSAQIYSGSGKVLELWLSSGSTGLNWAQLISTVALTVGPGEYRGFANGQKVTPSIAITTTSQIGIQGGQITTNSMQKITFGENGLRVNDLYFFKTSGPEESAVIRWKR